MARFIAGPILTGVLFGAGGKEFCVANVVIEPDPDIQEIAGSAVFEVLRKVNPQASRFKT
jgi:hypothetical protein